MKQRIVILGTTGSGKTTLAKRLSKKLGIPHVELDALYWNPNWVETEVKPFREKIKNALDQETWVVDGNYSKGRDLIWPKAQTVIWLNYSFFTILRQICKRTFANSKAKKELWPGCPETFHKQLLTKDSIFVWFLRSYWKKRRTIPEYLKEYPDLRVIRVRSPKELDEKLSSL